MRTQQLSITFPKKKPQYKQELMRMKNEENLNVSSYLVSLLEKDMGWISPPQR